MPRNDAESSTTQGSLAKKSDHVGRDLLQLVGFRLDGEEYGLEILNILEIIRMRDLTRVPNSPGFVEGVINLRGKVIPVVGLRKRLGLGPREHTKETRIIIVELKGDVLGFEVDSVSEVLRISRDAVEPPPRLSNRNSDFISGVGKLRDRLLLLLDLNRVMGEAEPIDSSVSVPPAPAPPSEEALVV
jgi:purine-binding chemotaxis protein CheW